MNNDGKPSFNLFEVGKRFKENRVKKGIVLMDMADDLKMSRNTISEYEKYPINMTLSTLLSYEDYLNVSAAYLLFGANILKPDDISLAHELFMKWGQELLQEALPCKKNGKCPFK